MIILAFLPSVLALVFSWIIIQEIRKTIRERYCNISRRRLDCMAIFFAAIAPLGFFRAYGIYFVSIPAGVCLICLAVLVLVQRYFALERVSKKVNSPARMDKVSPLPSRLT